MAEKFVTILTVTHPQQLAIIRSRLEDEGIECFVQDELMAQVYNFGSNAIGGAKLQVRESNVEEAVAILKESGYLREEDLQPPTFMPKFDVRTAKLPWIGRWSVEARFLFLVVVAVVIVVAMIFCLQWLAVAASVGTHL